MSMILTDVVSPLDAAVIAFDAGYLSTALVKGDGTVWGSGYNGQGQLGLSTGGVTLVFKRAPGISGNVVLVVGWMGGWMGGRKDGRMGGQIERLV